MKKIIICFLFFIPLFCKAQFKVTFKLTVPAAFADKTISFASNLNNWTPGAENFILQKAGENTFTITMLNCPASFKGKFTCGSWKTVECTTEEKDVADRVFTITKDESINVEVANFRQVQAEEKYSIPRSAQVIIVNDSFYIPQLQTKRRIWMYVPKSYDGKKKYPVLYMQDGQNLFDPSTAYSGEWGVDEYLDNSKKECIVIGIDNGAERMQEYNPYDDKKYGKGKGKAYIDFIVQTLKPYIDKTYPTLANKNNTFLAGSSMGGLISYYAGVKYANTFGKVIVLSPSFWLCEKDINNTLKTTTNIAGTGFYFYYGQKESNTLAAEVKRVAAATKQKCTTCNITISENKNGEHNEKYWQAELPKIFDWLFTYTINVKSQQ
jgi:predicted alpha/beta superfamily hydrolase